MPRMLAPASTSWSTTVASERSTGAAASHAGLPAPTFWPATAKRSLTATLSPTSGPAGAPGTSGSPTPRQTRVSIAGAGSVTWLALTRQPSAVRAHSWVC